MGVKKKVILVVDDEPNIRRVLEAMLVRDGYQVLTADAGRKAVDIAATNTLDLLITDLIMPDMTGIEVLREVKQTQPHCAALVITAYGTIKSAVEAMRLGAYNYIAKPFDLDEVRVQVQHALENRALKEENILLREQLRSTYRLDNIVGVSGKMQEVFKLVHRAADTRSTVLIRGESGTGKELIARALHFNSQRAARPFIAVSCAALTETLLESELFGHEKGAFTGAMAQKPGRFELANHGTLFLDEIAEITPAIQVKLLRVLQEREFERVGGTRPIRVDVRVVAATNKNLEEAVQKGEFRDDLYYRLQVIQIMVPPLRERPEDIPALAEHFLAKYSRENGRHLRRIAPEVMERLLRYRYPGNVRELENIIERAVVLADRDAEEITPDLLPPSLQNA
ncbi:MAG: sigma-54-dependent transcriptional regulator [Chthonomonadales bacterium]